MLAVLVAERSSYTYVDRVGNAPSKDTLLFYLRESLRDFSSLLDRGFESIKAKDEVEKIDMDGVNSELEIIKRIDPSDRKRLREISSIISAKALALAVKIRWG